MNACHSRSFAGVVRLQQAEDFIFLHVEGEVFHSNERAVCLVKTIDADHFPHDFFALGSGLCVENRLGIREKENTIDHRLGRLSRSF